MIAEANRADLKVSLDVAKQILDKLDLRYTIAADDQEIIRDIAEHDVQEMRSRYSKIRVLELWADLDGIQPPDGKGVWDNAFDDIKRRLEQRRQRLRTGDVPDNTQSNQEAIDILRNLPPRKPLKTDVAVGKTAVSGGE